MKTFPVALPVFLPLIMTLLCCLVGWLEDRADETGKAEGQEASSQPLPAPARQSGAGFEAPACRTFPGLYDPRRPRKQTWK